MKLDTASVDVLPRQQRKALYGRLSPSLSSLRADVTDAKVLVVAFSSLARILGECSTIYFPPAHPPPPVLRSD